MNICYYPGFISPFLPLQTISKSKETSPENKANKNMTNINTVNPFTSGYLVPDGLNTKITTQK